MDRFAAVERALRKAPPHALLDALRTTLRARYGAAGADLLMADYAMTILQPVEPPALPPEPLSAHLGAPGRAFGSQQPYAENFGECTLVHVPVTVRGDRLGILTVRLPEGGYDEGMAGELADIGEVLGHEILVAERDTDLYQQARRARRLTLAAELQWQLLPGRSCSRPEYALGAQLEPAYAIRGDNFDWSGSAETLHLSVTNGMGEGIEAALLTNLAVNALRNARRAGLGLADQAALADQAIYGHHQGNVHLSTLLLRFELATGEAEVVDAGSPQLWRQRDGVTEQIELDAQLPLGMFEDTVYTAQRFRVLPGDRLFFFSDGVYEALSPAGEPYGKRALAAAMTGTRLLPTAQVPYAVLKELAAHRGSLAQDDDAMVLCMDWHGRQAPL
ncbi:MULTISPECIES: PP2C family protein-serine/threonine phosphatase [unclassified Streptomyces]|uniref:PP2C family protein-serine/threonine phosphatase n=1 Tax=unclassified Streptomyces TaxID=2593676 RepID=UPI00081F6F87|nr:PP2C family protein-serine/threonine phosphatase [Streptomyces sp. LcepLS]SCE98765.1 Serine phosphatase RsbU, regulator of sigma subunit [Streptomyces sp. LcepLS]